MRAIIVVLLSFGAIMAMAMILVTPAAAQGGPSCQVDWDFDDGQPGPWAAAGHAVISGTLQADNGSQTVLTLAELQAALGNIMPISSDGASMALDATLAGGGAVQIVLSYTDGVTTTNTYSSNGNHTLNAVSGHFLQSVAIQSHSANVYDNLVLSVPCGAMGPPTPTPWPTPNATSVFSTTGGFDGPLMPQVIPLSPVTNTIDFDALWDASNFTGMASVVMTFFSFENVPQFFALFLPGMGMVIALRLIMRIVARRNGGRAEEEI